MTEYYTSLIHAVTQAGLHRPALVLDRARLAANLSHLRSHLPQGVTLRLADKSLPVPDLLQLGFDGLDCHQVMSFHLPLTTQVLNRFPGTRALMGKPMPAAAAAQFLRGTPDAERVTWLIDSAERLAAFRQLAQETGKTLRIAFEVNIGLNRGGFPTPDALRAALSDTAPLTICGIMGYEAHTHALPSLLGGGTRAQAVAMSRLAGFADPLPPDQREIINTGGSSSVLDLPPNGPGNDFTLGSIMVKPSDFDQAVNAAIQPALFMVTPVLKTVPHGLPGHPRLSHLLRKTRLIRDRIAFIYGGKWMAKPVWPSGLNGSPFFAPSSNQEGFCLPRNTPAPDHVILRPTQSETVLHTVPDIHVFDGSQITGTMRPFDLC